MSELNLTNLEFRHKEGEEETSVGLAYWGKGGGGKKIGEWGSPWNLGNTNPFSFHEANASCLFNLSLELFDLESIQLLGSHVHEVK